jgi:uncharacterized protein
VFQSAGLLTSSAVVMAAIIGVSAIPGAFIAKRISTRISARLHTGLLDAVVILGGILLVIEAIRAASSV